MRKLMLGGLVVLLTACGSATEGEELGDVGQPIINGLAPTSARHEAVVSLHSKYVNTSNFSPSPFCSGTLIDDEWVLTAAHCVHRRKANTLAVNASDDPSLSFSPQAVSEVRVHSGYDSRRLHNDIALLRLSQASTGTTVSPLPGSLNFTQADVDAALNINFAGFGYSNLEKTEFGVKLQVDQPLGGLGCSVDGCPSGMPTDTQISYDQDPDGPCNGDSGGPGFVDREGTWYVGAITSYGDGSCSNYGASTNAAAFESWLASNMAPVVEPPPPGGGECLDKGASCTTGSECCSGSCGGKPGSRTCK